MYFGQAKIDKKEANTAFTIENRARIQSDVGEAINQKMHGFPRTEMQFFTSLESQ